MGLMDLPIKMALNKTRDSYINPQLEGIGILEELNWKDGKLSGVLRLVDMEDQPIEVTCSDIKMSPDASSVRIGSFSSNKKFAETALKRFAENRDFSIPEGAARIAAKTAKKILNL